MTRALPTLLFVITFSQFSFASLYSILPCPGATQQEVLDECQALQIKIISSSNNENFVLVNVTNESHLDNFCYYAKVRQLDQHLCFNTNILFVKVSNTSSSIIHENELKAHPSIPNLFYAYPNVRNDQELLIVKESLQLIDGVDYVGYNQVFTLNANVNDPLYPRQWAIENNGTPQQYNGTPGADMSVNIAWTTTTGSDQIRIAVLDSGVDTLHEDLSSNLLHGFDGFADSISDTHGHPTPNFSSDGHGTSCAGIIAAEGDNGLGIAGIAYGSKIIPVRIFYYLDYGTGIGIQATTNTNALLSGFAYAWRDLDADILSASAGLNGLFIQALGIDTTLVNAELQAAHIEARNWKGIPMFFSSGNDNSTEILWPANLPTTIAVGASSMCDERKSPSDCSGENWGGNYDLGLDIVAPGVKIATSDMMGASGFSTGNYTNTFNGTSASCPNAAGVAALILSINSNLYAEDIRAILNITAERVPGYVYDSLSIYGSWNTEMGHGRVNADSAITLAQTYQSSGGINETDDLFSFTVYPNPTTNEFTLKIQGNQTYELELLNIQGQVLLHKREVQSKDVIDLTELSSGVYFVRLHSKEASHDVRFIKK